MAKTLLATSDVNAAQSGTYYVPLIQASWSGAGPAEALSNVPMLAGTLRKLSWNQNAVNNAGNVTTVRIRVNGANSALVAAAPAGALGIFQDFTHEVTIADGDLVGVAMIGSSPVYSDAISTITLEYEASAGTVTVYGGPSLTFSGATTTTSGTNYLAFGKNGGIVSGEESVQSRVGADGTFSQFQAHVDANTKTVTTFAYVRVNGADSALAIAIPAGTTGIAADSTHNVAIHPGDLIDVRYDGVGGTGGMSWAYFSVRFTGSGEEFDSHNGYRFSSGNIGNTVTYSTIFGAVNNYAVEGDAQACFPFDTIATNLRLKIATGGIFGTLPVTWKLRINGNDGDMAVTVANDSSAGWFEDISTYDQILAGDLVCIKRTAASTSFAGAVDRIQVTFRHGLIINQNIRPGTGVVEITGLTPVVKRSALVVVGEGSLVITGNSVHAAPIWHTRPGKDQLAIGAVAPTIKFSGRSLPGAGGLVIQGLSPLVNEIVATQLGVLALAEISAPVRASSEATLVAVEIHTDPLVSAQAVLIAGEIIPPAATSSQAVLILAAGDGCTSMRCQLWRITRRDGQVFRFTSLDVEYPWGSEIYEPCRSLDPSASESQSQLGSTGSIELQGIISSERIKESELYGGLFDDCFVEVWLANFDPSVAEPPRRLAGGWAGNLSHGEKGFKLEVLGPGTRLDQQAIVQTVAPSCNWVFGDGRCTFDREAIKLTGSVGRPRTRTQFDADITGSAGTYQWANGLVRWTSGVNEGQICEVKSVNFATGAIVLWGLPAFQPERGDEFDLLPGCDRLASTCKDVYHNLLNFGGYPDVPGNDAIADVPDAKV